eukprot:290039_1
MSIQEATGVVITFGAGNAIGVVVGGMLGHFSYKKSVKLPPFIMGVSTALTSIPFAFLINSVSGTTNAAIVTLVGVVTGILAVIPVPIERAILSNVTSPEARGRANSLLGIVDDLGKGLGPLFVAQLISAHNRQVAFNITIVGFIAGGVLSLLVILFVRKDEENVQVLVRSVLDKKKRHDGCSQGANNILPNEMLSTSLANGL